MRSFVPRGSAADLPNPASPKLRFPASRAPVMLAAFATLVAAFVSATPAGAGLGDCAQPLTAGASPLASDCAYILKVAVGTNSCTPDCICAPTGSLPAKASDALLCLRKAVGQDVTLACPCDLLPAGDDFNDNSRDPALWANDETDGNGRLSETGGRLEYRCNPGTDYDLALRPWIGSAFPFDQDWEARVDVANFTVPNQNDQLSTFGISIVDALDFGNEVFGELYASHLETPPARNGFYAELFDDGSFVDFIDSGAKPVVTGAVRVTFQATTKVFRFYYDINLGDGYSWVEYGSFGVAGSGGASANANWGMAASDVFYVSLYGFSSSMSVAAGQIWGDNFQTTGGVAFQ